MKGKLCKVTSILVAILMCTSVTFTSCGQKSNDPKQPTKQGEKDSSKTDASILGADDITIDELSEFDPLEGVTAKGADDKDVSGDIVVTGEVDTLTPGEYKLTYKLKGTDLSVKRMVTVKGVEAQLANGIYNYKFASAEIRNTLMAAAEDYLLHNQYAGIPLFANAGFKLYSNRMQLVSQNYLPVLGFGVAYSSMSADDSTVTMEDGEKGNAGEYTYRVAFSTNPKTFNQWKSDDGTTSDIMEYYVGNLFSYQFNDDKSGYLLKPAMADGEPIAVEGRELPSGKVVSKKWQIKIKPGQEWAFNENTDTSMITDYTINAVDFYETYKLALEKKWFRAISGGSDFCGGDAKIQNAQEFVDGTASWEDVGIKLIDDNTIELHFVDEQSQWNVKYSYADTTMTPVNMELYNALGEEQYGLDEKSIGYTGRNVCEYYESDKVLRFKKNEKYIDKDLYFYTGVNIRIIDQSEMRFQEFVAGNLDSATLPSGNYEEYKSHPGLKRVPGTTTFRMMINGLGTPEEQVGKFPDSTWEPEAILSNQDFKMAMFHAVDRKKLAEEVMKTSQTQMYLFTDAYIVEAETGIPYRHTPQGKSVGADLSPSTNGYNLDAAKAYYEKALDKLVADGVYKNGDEVKFEFYYMSGSESSADMGDYLKKAFEAAFQSEKYDINVVLDPMPKDFPGIYYDHMMIGEFDTSIGGISGSALNAASFLDTYCTDNRSGFSLNWGVTTENPEITVSYVDEEGNNVKELWSYDALVMALTGETEVKDGREVKKEVEEEAETE